MRNQRESAGDYRDADHANAMAVHHANLVDKHQEKASEYSRSGLSTEPGKSTESPYERSEKHRELAGYHDKASTYYRKASESLDLGKHSYAQEHMERAERWGLEANDYQKEHKLELESDEPKDKTGD